MLWAACSVALFAAAAEATESASPVTMVRGCQWEASSPNFAVRNFHRAHDARLVAEYCERWRAKLQKYWIAQGQDNWQIKCEVVVHAGVSAYLAAVGSGARQTFGSS